MNKICLLIKNHAPLICACILAGILALSAVWLRSAAVKGAFSKHMKAADTQSDLAQTPETTNIFHPPALGEVIVPYQADALVFNSTTRVYETHPGMDFLCPDGQVYAVFSGRVDRIKNDPLYGLTVELSGPNGDWAVYASLSKANVKAGAHVTAGEVIGICGETAALEAGTGPHLHFEYRKNGKAEPISFATAPKA